MKKLALLSIFLALPLFAADAPKPKPKAKHHKHLASKAVVKSASAVGKAVKFLF